MEEHDVEAIWHDFWIPCLDVAVEGQPLGQSIAIPGAYWDQIKREMYDYHALMDGLSVLYDDITGGRASKPNTDRRVIAELVDDRVSEAYNDGWRDGESAGYSEGYSEGLLEVE